MRSQSSSGLPIFRLWANRSFGSKEKCLVKPYICMVIKVNMSILSEILSSKVREKIFEHLFNGQGAEIHVRELQRRSGCSIGTIQTELKKLSRLDLVTSRRDGNRLYYRGNQDHPLYPDICSMIEKTVGLFAQLRAAFERLQSIECVFIFGSVAAGVESANSDVDLMIIGDIGLRDLSTQLADIAAVVGREINPHVVSAGEFRRRAEEKEHFIAAVMRSTKVFIRGGEDDFAKLAG